VTSSVGNAIVHDPSFDWHGDDFHLAPWNELVVYELHVGTFNDQEDADHPGKFPSVSARLGHLKMLGVNAIQIMPVGVFAGDRSWGYNPAHIFSVESTYGGPLAFKQFVKRAHQEGIAVILDVVYNHLGPSDLDLWQFDGWSENNRGGIYFYNDDAFDRVIYSESHDEVANGRARVPQEISPNDPKGWYARKRSTLAAAMVFTAPGIPMLFQGQEFLEGGWFRDTVPVDWDQNADDVVVVANFFHDAQDGYVIGFPTAGTWKLRFNSDWQGYNDDFKNHPSTDVAAEPGASDGLPCQAAVSIGPYRVLIFSQAGEKTQDWASRN